MKVSDKVETENYSLIVNKKFFLQRGDLSGFKLATLFYQRLLDLCEEVDEEEDPEKIERIREKMLHTENRIQKVWGFRPNYDYHRYWSKPNSCCCKMTEFRSGITEKKYSPNCKIHKHLI